MPKRNKNGQEPIPTFLLIYRTHLKNWLAIATLLALLAACTIGTREQIERKLGEAALRKIESNVDERIGSFMCKLLNNPSSYEPISTDLRIMMNHDLVSDKLIYIAARDLLQSVDDFHETFGNDSTSAEAVEEIAVLVNKMGIIKQFKHNIEIEPIKFLGIDARQQFYTKSKSGKKVKCDYHFLIKEDNSITLMGDHEEFVRVANFLGSMGASDTIYVVTP